MGIAALESQLTSNGPALAGHLPSSNRASAHRRIGSCWSVVQHRKGRKKPLQTLMKITMSHSLSLPVPKSQSGLPGRSSPHGERRFTVASGRMPGLRQF